MPIDSINQPAQRSGGENEKDTLDQIVKGLAIANEIFKIPLTLKQSELLSAQKIAEAEKTGLEIGKLKREADQAPVKAEQDYSAALQKYNQDKEYARTHGLTFNTKPPDRATYFKGIEDVSAPAQAAPASIAAEQPTAFKPPPVSADQTQAPGGTSLRPPKRDFSKMAPVQVEEQAKAQDAELKQREGETVSKETKDKFSSSLDIIYGIEGAMSKVRRDPLLADQLGPINKGPPGTQWLINGIRSGGIIFKAGERAPGVAPAALRGLESDLNSVQANIKKYELFTTRPGEKADESVEKSAPTIGDNPEEFLTKGQATSIRFKKDVITNLLTELKNGKFRDIDPRAENIAAEQLATGKLYPGINKEQTKLLEQYLGKSTEQVKEELKRQPPTLRPPENLPALKIQEAPAKPGMQIRSKFSKR